MATIAEKSRTKDIIDRLQSILNTASPVPLASGKVTIYKDEVQSLLTELASQIEIELKTYHEVNDRKGKIINEAKKEAEKIIYEAEHSASRMRVNKRTTNVAPIHYEELSEEERDALSNANEIYGASLIYTDEMLTEVNELIETAYQNIQTDYQNILQDMEQKMNIIAANRAELMDGLQEMDVADRSQQIIEIGHLLSDELYNARMRNHVGSDQYDDGSVQLSMDFQQLQEERARVAEEKAEQAANQALAAEMKSAQAEAALANMMAERDALALKVSQIQKEKEALSTAAQAAQNAAAQQPAETDEDEYEVVYVTEDELEEGEEYEIEYVDEEAPEEDGEYQTEYVDEEDQAEDEVTEEPESSHHTEQMKKDSDEKNQTQTDDVLPLIPHFKKSEKITSVPSERIAKMAENVTTDPRYRGLISKAVEDKAAAAQEAEQHAPTDKKAPVVKKEKTQPKAADTDKATDGNKATDQDVKVDEKGQEYVQATMKFDEDFEIMEF
ncbi:uncharacterized protein BN724_00151 [Clostridium sp. CAG:590]|nr:uncharacterized protein BN724_00151 [Clostridium sp. CAG:590]